MNQTKKKSSFKIDERNKAILKNLCTILYAVNVYGMLFLILYYQMILKRPSSEYEDLSRIFTLNVIVFLAALLFMGGISFKSFNPKIIIGLYMVLCIAGFGFVAIKYGVSDLAFLADKMVIVMAILAILFLVWFLFAFAGKKLLDRKLSDDE